MADLATPTDPDTLTKADLAEIDVIADYSDDELDRSVNDWIANHDDASGRRVFCSEQLAARVLASLSRLIHEAEIKEQNARNRTAKLQTREHKLTLSRQRTQHAQIIESMKRSASAANPNKQAEAVVAELFPKWKAAAARELKNGKTKAEVVKELRERIRREGA